LWLAAAVPALIVVGVVVAVSSGSGGDNRSLGLGPSVDSTVLPPAGARRPAQPARARPFVPAPAAVRVENSLSLDRQVAQLFMVSLNGTDAPSVSSLGGVDWGGVAFTSQNFVTDGQMGALAGDVASTMRAAGPVQPLLAVTQPGGPGTALPDLPPQPETAIADPSSALSQARAAGRMLSGLGFNMTLAPFADVDIPGGGALTDRLFGSDPNAVASLSVAAVEGYRAAGIISAPGHFPGEGAASADPDQMTATVGGPLAQLEARDLIPFMALAAKAPVIMMSNASYAAFDGVTPASLLPQAVQLLRGDYGFRGAVMSDDLDATLQATGSGPGTVALQALQAGDDLIYISGPPSEHQAAYAAVLAAAQRSAPVRALVQQAVLHVLTLKARYGILR
jgi:beta-N-acetylhexosaminidase